MEAALCFTRDQGWHLVPAPALLAAFDRPEKQTRRRRVMRTLSDAQDQFAYHPATPETAPKHAAVRDLFRDLLPALWEAIPDGPEKTLAIRKLQEAQMYANLAIALTAPADTGETRSVARQLPDKLVEHLGSGGTIDKPTPPEKPNLSGVPDRPPPVTATTCACGETQMSSNEPVYVEGHKRHRRKPDVCGPV